MMMHAYALMMSEWLNHWRLVVTKEQQQQQQ
jgi:hypothetical protein